MRLARIFLTVMMCAACRDLAAQAKVVGKRPIAHDPNKAEPLTFVVTPVGFSRTALELENGLYDITFVNRTGGRPLQLELDRLEGGAAKVTAGDLTPAHQRFSSIQRLTPGTYKLSVLNVPAWVCTLTVK